MHFCCKVVVCRCLARAWPAGPARAVSHMKPSGPFTDPVYGNHHYAGIIGTIWQYGRVLNILHSFKVIPVLLHKKTLREVIGAMENEKYKKYKKYKVCLEAKFKLEAICASPRTPTLMEALGGMVGV